MKIIRTPKAMQAISARLKRQGKTSGFVPTMGALHAGHLSLIRKARQENKRLIVSIFVNPAQFGPKEDLKHYPRPLKKDLSLCKREGVDFVFLPSSKDMYTQGFSTYIKVLGLNNVLCGKFRPGHFQGVATVVGKLFNIIQPDKAYFGAKDAQQCALIKRMVKDLNMPVKIRILPIMRDKDGLALSSRNIYLSNEERRSALALSSSLKLAKQMISDGIRSADRIISAIKRMIGKEKKVKIDYVAIVDNENLKPLKIIKGNILIALAARIGKTRLIDNIVINK